MSDKEESKKRKYVLFKKDDGRADAQKPCAFFASAAGCKNGSNCKFFHQEIKVEEVKAVNLPVNLPVPPVKSSKEVEATPKTDRKRRKTLSQPTVVASSDESTANREIDLLKEQLQIQQRLFEEQLNLLKGTLSKQSLPIASEIAVKSEPLKKGTLLNTKPSVPVNKASSAIAASSAAANDDSDDTTDDEFLFNVVNHALDNGREDIKGSDDVVRNINNSVTPLKLNTSKNTSLSNSVNGRKSETKLIMPELKNSVDENPFCVSSKKTDINKIDFNKVDYQSLDWQKLVTRTRAHKKHKTDYTLQTDATWVTSRKEGTWSSSLNIPKVIALDCEMCETADPVTGARDSAALVRFSVINGLNPQEVLIDTLVAPNYPVIDMRTRIHGIAEKQLQGVKFTLRHAQAALLNMVSDQTIIIGHSVYNDLKALHFNHDLCIDTAYLFSVLNENESSLPGLKLIADQLLAMDLPETHNPIEDARISLYAAVYACLTEPGIQQQVTRKATSETIALLVHRIPSNCTEEHIKSMFVAFSHVVPSKVSNIVRGDLSSSDPVGKALVSFSSLKHAELAFETIEGPVRVDKRNTPQKRIYLQGGGYVCVRKYKM